MAALTFPTLPLRVVRGVAARVQTALARRTAPPVVLAAKAERLTRLSHRALAELHERALAADAADLDGALVVVGAGRGGAALVLADARSSAREVQVFGADDPASLTEVLTRHGFPPHATRVTLRGGAPQPGDGPVALAAVGHADPGAVTEVLPVLLDRLAPGGVVVLSAYEPYRDAVDAACDGRPVRLVQQTLTHIVREGP